MAKKRPSDRYRYGSEHRRLSETLRAQAVPGVTLCGRCGHPLNGRVELDHLPAGIPHVPGALYHVTPGGILYSVSHGWTACSTCRVKCNHAAAGTLGALAQGKRLRSGRQCPFCGIEFSASNPDQASCGAQACITQLRRLRKAHEPLPEPPAQCGRTW